MSTKVRGGVHPHDNHLHIILGGLNFNLELRWDGVNGPADAMGMLRRQVAVTPAPQWVRVVGGFTEHQFVEKRLPTIDELNSVAPDTPVFLLHLYDRALLNGAALRAVGYTRDTPAPPGGEIVRDGAGNPSGLLLAKPNAPILYATLAKGPKLPYEYQLNSTRRFMRELNRLGVTGAIDAGGGFQNYPDDYRVVQELAVANQLTIRLAYNLFTQKPEQEKQDFLSIDRIAALGGGVAVQHRMAYQREYFVERYGAAAAEATPPVKRMLEKGVRVSAGTDATRVASYNPWVSLSWLVTGKTVGGLQITPQRNCLSRDEALRMWTENVTWFSNEVGKKGRIEVGQFADLVVPDRDFFACAESEIADTSALLTMVGVQVVWGAGDFAVHDDSAPPPAMPNWSSVRRFGGYGHWGEQGARWAVEQLRPAAPAGVRRAVGRHRAGQHRQLHARRGQFVDGHRAVGQSGRGRIDPDRGHLADLPAGHSGGRAVRHPGPAPLFDRHPGAAGTRQRCTVVVGEDGCADGGVPGRPHLRRRHRRGADGAHVAVDRARAGAAARPQERGGAQLAGHQHLARAGAGGGRRATCCWPASGRRRPTGQTC